MALEAGSKLGPYEIIEEAGAGGMGQVFKAKDTRLDRLVAVKVLPPTMHLSPEMKQRFEREAKSISSLNHPNICILHDIGEQDGVDYLVMEFIEGESLADKLKSGPMPVDELLRIATQIADALDKAHRQGLVHRDLKPGNIMFTKEGAKLLDFGLAKYEPNKAVAEGVSVITQTTPLTGTGTIVGTMQYMAPEQLEGKEADARSDIFSFGVVLYEMVTGLRAFSGDSQASLIGSIMKEEPRAVSQVQPMAPPILERAIKQCIAKDPDQRWQTAGDLKRSLQWIAEGGSQVGIPVPVTKRRKMTNRLAWSLAAVFIAATCTLGGLYYSELSKPIDVVRSNIVLSEGNNLAPLAGGQLAISPDGRNVVYAAMDSSESDPKLWVRPVNSLTAIPLQGTEYGYFPFWSPDGKYIGFFAGGKLKKTLATGGPTHTVTEAQNGRGASWSEQGDIIFSPAISSEIHRVSSAGGISTPITSLKPDSGELTHRWPEFLPDSEHFLFFSRYSGDDDDWICLGSIAEGLTKRLFRANSNMFYVNGYIVYTYESSLMAQRFDKGSLELVGEAFPIAENVTYVPGWSRGVFVASKAGHLLYREGEVNSGSLIMLTDRAGLPTDTIDNSAYNYVVRFSPDDRSMVTSMEELNQTSSDVWIMDRVRGTKTRISFEEGNDITPVWSPDGKRVAYRSVNEGKYQIWIKNADGTGTASLLREMDKTIFLYDWVANDDLILIFYVAQDGSEIWGVPVDSTKEPFPLIQLPGEQYGPAISPDGRWLAYGSDESGREQVYITSYPSMQGRWQVSIDEGDRPTWSGDGRNLYYLDNEDVIQSAQIDGTGSAIKVGKISRMFEVENAARPGNIFDVTSDGQTFLINVTPEGIVANSLVLVQNWTAELEDN